MTSFRRYLVLACAILASALGVSLASQPQATREPASRAAVVLTWNQAQREAGFAGMETIFLTRTVRASARPRLLRMESRCHLHRAALARTNSIDSSRDRKWPACSCSTTARSASSGTR
jgi:hypothetical protein